MFFKSHPWKMLGIFLSSIRCSDCIRLNMPTSRSSRSELHITAAHSSSFGKSGPFFLGRVCGFLGAWTLLSFGKSANDCRGHKSRTTQAYLQWCSCYEILWIYFHCTSYNKSSKALDEGLRFAQSHQSSVTYVPQEFMVRSCPCIWKKLSSIENQWFEDEISG